MLRSYQGYFYNKQFISLDNIPIPEKKKVIITVLDDELTDIKADAQISVDIAKQQRLAFEEYFKAIDAIKGEDFTEEDFMELENNRLSFRREFNL